MWTLDRRQYGEARTIQSETEGRLSMTFATPTLTAFDDLSQTYFGVELKRLMKISSPSPRFLGV
jgi:hypothetical protein